MVLANPKKWHLPQHKLTAFMGAQGCFEGAPTCASSCCCSLGIPGCDSCALRACSRLSSSLVHSCSMSSCDSRRGLPVQVHVHVHVQVSV